MAAFVAMLACFYCDTAPLQAQDLIMRRTNSVGNWHTILTNNGILFNQYDSLHPLHDGVGGYWDTPQGETDSLVYGAGLWFGGLRHSGDSLRPHVEYSYEPNHVGTHFVPGSILYGGALIDTSEHARNKYRVYRSDDLVGYPWPVRLINGKARYVDNEETRLNVGPPAILGDQDIFIIYKDTDPRASDDTNRRPFGYEVRTQLSYWKKGLLKDVVIVRSEIINTSSDTIFQPVTALALDGDVQVQYDDRLKNVQDVEGAQAAVFFSAFSKADPLLGVTLLRGMYGSHRRTAGLTTLRYWDIDDDPITDSARYAFLTEARHDTSLSRIGDARVLISSKSQEPLLPGDTIGFDFAVFAKSSSGAEQLAPIDSAEMLTMAKNIISHYLSGTLPELRVRSSRPAPSIRFYPDPAQDFLHLECDPGADIRICDATGRVLLRAVASTDRLDLDLRNLPSGVLYLFRGSTSPARFIHFR